MARVDMSANYRRQDPEKIADVFKYVSLYLILHFAHPAGL